MLVLARKRGEIINIGPITVQVLAVKGSQVKLGVVAPQDMPIWRSVNKETHDGEAKPA